jgi:hypothetical protein
MRKLYITSPIPLVDTEKTVLSNVIEVDLEVLNNLWSRFLSDLNTIAQSIYESLLKQGSPCLNRYECRVRLLTDVVVSFIKHLVIVPLAPPPVTRKALNLLHPQDIFLLYAILEGYCRYASTDHTTCALFNALDTLLVGDSIADLPESMDRIQDAVKSLVNVIGVNAFNLIFDPYTILEEDHTKVCRDGNVYRLGLIRCVPADTRPGFNTSSLLVHSLLTSALARLIFEHKVQKLAIVNKDLATEITRLAAVLHDIGKPIAWYETFTKAVYTSHVSDAVLSEVWGRLREFEKLLGTDIWVYVKILVKCHHSSDTGECIESEFQRHALQAKLWPVNILVAMAESIALADRVASAVDRVKRVIEDRKAEIARIANTRWQDIADLFEYDERSWFWQIKAEDSLVERVAKAVAQSVMSEPGVAGADGGEVVEGVAIGIADIREIQRFISREDLRTVIGGSIAVDIATLTIIPALLLKVLDLNIEHILYSGGGVVNFLTKSGGDGVKILKEAYTNLNRKARWWLPGVVFVEVELLNDWRATMRRLFTKLAVTKMLPQNESLALHVTDLGIGVVCELCGRRPATAVIERSLLVCDSCRALRALGDNFYVKAKLNVLKEVGYGVDRDIEGIDTVMKYLMMWLSGHRGWWYGEGFNIAVLYADMNLGGLFFANSLSMSEMFTKSVLVDYALKKALYIALKAVRDAYRDVYGEAYGDHILSRCYVGVLYAGGDDLLAIVPSQVAPLLALYISVVFWSIIGSRQLSISIASAKPKQNIWNVIDTAKKLLDEAKDFIRREVENFEELKSIAGVVTVIYSDKQLLPAYIDVIEIYRSIGMLSQPLIIKVELVDGFRFSESYNSFTTMLNLFSSKRITNVKDLLDTVNQGKALLIQSSSDVEDFVREVYHVAKTQSVKVEEMPIKAAVYAVNYYIKIRNTEFGYKLREFLTPVINDLSKFMQSRSKVGIQGFFPLYDLYLIQKILKG